MVEVIVKSLCSVANILMGQSPPGETYNKEGKGIPLLNGPTEFGLDHPSPCLWTTAPTKICEKGDLLFCVRGTTTGRMNWADQPYCIGRGLCAIQAKTGSLDTFYVYYTLVSELSRLLSFCSGSVFLNLSRKDLEQFEIGWFTDAKARAKTALILKDLDDGIKLNQKMNQTLEDFGRIIFKHWFVDFEFPNEEGKPYKSSGGQMVNSEIGDIPKCWSVFENISEICDKINYGYTQSASTEEVGPRFLRVMDINKADWIDWSAVPFCQIEEKNKSKYLLSEGDIVIARMADPGKIAIFESKIPAVFASYLIRIRLKNPSLAYYLYYLMKSPYYQNFIEGAATGSVQKNLNAKALTTCLPIVIPSKEVAFLFNSIVENLRSRINHNTVESTTLSNIRDALLPKMIFGKIRIPLANENMEAQ